MIEIVQVGGWCKDKFYGMQVESLYIIGPKKKESAKAVKIGSEWIPKACIEGVQEISEKEFKELLESASDEEEVIKRLGLNANTFVERDPDTFIAYLF